MIKLANIPDKTMDIVMEVARSCNKRPDQVIKIMLGLISENDAKEAVQNEDNSRGTKPM